MLFLLALVPAVLAQTCLDMSTNCWAATHGGDKDYCTNSPVCPTCGEYMREHCRRTCRAYIEECGDQCFVEGAKAVADTSGDSYLGTKTDNKLKKCQKRCRQHSSCEWVQYQHSTKTCEMFQGAWEPSVSAAGWVTAMKDCDVPEN